MEIQDQCNFLFIGSLSDTNELAAVGLGQMVVNLTAYSLVVGMNTALETLVSQAYGRANLRDCGLYLHRSILMIATMLVPLYMIIPYTATMLMYVGVNPVAAALTS